MDTHPIFCFAKTSFMLGTLYEMSSIFSGGRKMQNLLEELKKLLEQDERLVVEGKLLKNKIIESALKLDVDLIRLLLKNETIKTHFFQEVDGVLVFDKIKYQKFVSNKAFLPDSYTSFKNKIGLVTENEEYLSESKEVVLAWPYKDCVLEGGMEKENEKRDEIFYNEILAPDEIDRLLEPKVLTNFKRIDKNGEHKVQEIKGNDNLIIRGNNLLALHSLQKRFAGKVKLIYIDPPYNTGNDSFKYNDNFNHSSWLTFMKSRLRIAKELLSRDGSLWINIDDNESHYLKILCDEIFGRENFLINFIWQKKYSPSNDAKWFSDNHDHILVFAKNKELFKPNLLPRTDEMNNRYSNPDNDKRGDWKPGGFSVKTYTKNYDYPIKIPSGKIVNPPKGSCWQTSEANYKKMLADKRIWFGANGDAKPQIKQFLSEVQQGVVAKSIWLYDEVGHNQISRSEIIKLFGEYVFTTPKPEKLIKRIIELSTKGDDIVLDFFLGSGTTTAVAHKIKRRYIGIDQMDYIENVIVERMKKVINGEQGGISKSVNWQGGGDFVYCELMKLNEKYIDEIKKVKTTKQLLDIWNTMKEKAFLSYKVDIKQFDENVNEFEKLSIENQKKFLIECLDKNQLYINLSEIDDSEYEISKEDKELDKQFYEVK